MSLAPGGPPWGPSSRPAAGPAAAANLSVLAAAREVVVVLTLFQLYRFARLLSADEQLTARANADSVLELERRLGWPSELATQQWALQLDGLAQAANVYYLALHFPVVIALLGWLFVRQARHYRWVRDLLVAVTFASLVIHLAMPLAPPRMLPGFVDTGVVHGMSAYAGEVGRTANQIAAMPSLHVAWAAVAALAVVTVLRTRWRWLVLLHPAMTIAVVVVTGNHYWVDALVALLLLAVAALVVRRPSRR